ncbi:phage baseplate protein [Campylobacter pinnipediorum subsp. pinnipediorum]|uniref:Phage baseplate protein n=1 Tax=Campylobacter pinnipediorum subsp. pinnipediorum TaxID=1660067 RepID=A0AAX0LAJ8_9BACT|nr:baseplate J/gp47 family protein [Campylobacter pinnipediorum]OPA77252.1 phage baseplate protein [Campylobacter pinnipediorum subsp. pinnipediorum]
MRTPKFIKPLDIEKERQSIIEEFKTKSNKLDYVPLVGDDYMTLIDIFLFRLNNFFELINIKIANNYLSFSTGEYLDELVSLIGIKRNEEVRPIAQVEITVSSATFLPKGTKFTDGKGHFAYLLESTDIQDSKIVKIEATEYFKENYETTIIENKNIYVKSATMSSPFSGFKARENDDELRKRFLLAMHRFSTAGSAKSYLFYVLSVEGISKANVYNLSAGVVQIVYFSDYDEDTAKLKITEALKDKIPLTDKVKIKPATKISLDLTIQVKVTQDFMFNEVVKNIDFRIREFFKTLEIAQTPHTSKLIEVAFDDNTRAIEISTQIPKADRDSILILNDLQITKANYARFKGV